MILLYKDTWSFIQTWEFLKIALIYQNKYLINNSSQI